MQNIVFVYAKNSQINVLNTEEAQRLNAEYLENGWIHTATLDPCIFIQFMHNNLDLIDANENIKSLSNIETK